MFGASPLTSSHCCAQAGQSRPKALPQGRGRWFGRTTVGAHLGATSLRSDTPSVTVAH